MVEALMLVIILHGVGGYEIVVNPRLITSMRGPEGHKNFIEGARCLINLSDGKYVTVIETCKEVRNRMEEAK